MAKKWWKVSLIGLIFLLLGGCATHAHGPVSCSKICGDYNITLSSAKCVYDLSKCDSQAPLELTATLTYQGDKDKVMLWHGDTFWTLELITDGEVLLNKGITSILCSSEFEKGVSYEMTWTGESEVRYLGELPTGSYTARLWFSAFEDSDMSSKLDSVLELPFTIE